MILIKPVTKCSETRVEFSFTIVATQAIQIGMYTIHGKGIADKAIQSVVIAFNTAGTCPLRTGCDKLSE